MEPKMILRKGTKVEYYQNSKLVGLGKIVCNGTVNGGKVYDVDLDDGSKHWGYRHQFKVAPKT